MAADDTQRLKHPWSGAMIVVQGPYTSAEGDHYALILPYGASGAEADLAPVTSSRRVYRAPVSCRHGGEVRPGGGEEGQNK